MKKCLIILRSGVTLTIESKDVVLLCSNGKPYMNIKLEAIPLLLMNCTEDNRVFELRHIVENEGNKHEMYYVIRRDNVSWCYTQEQIEVKHE